MGVLRLLLALAVVFAHAGPLWGWRWLEMTGGPLAVQMFYVVSGFYMALILHEKYVGVGSYRAFVHNRLLRLFPIYFAVLVATLAVGLGLHACGHTIAPLAHWLDHGAAMPLPDALALAATQVTLLGQDVALFTAVEPNTHALFFTDNFHEEALPGWQFMLVPQAWTVAIELMFYGVAPLLVRRPVIVITGAIAASLALRVALMRAWHLGHDPWTYRFFPTELALFLAGSLAYRAYRWLQPRHLLRPSLCWLATLVTFAAVLGYRTLPAVLQTRGYGLAVILLGLPLALPFLFHLTARWRLDRSLGELSYPVYLVHYLLVFVVGAPDVPWLHEHRSSIVTLGSLGLAWLLWRGIGRPIERRRQRVHAHLAERQRAKNPAAARASGPAA